VTTYEELWAAIEQAVAETLGNPSRQLPNLLGYISDDGYERIGFMPTALVVYAAGEEHPGPGFLRPAASAIALPPNDTPPQGAHGPR